MFFFDKFSMKGEFSWKIDSKFDYDAYNNLSSAHRLRCIEAIFLPLNLQKST